MHILPFGFKPYVALKLEQACRVSLIIERTVTAEPCSVVACLRVQDRQESLDLQEGVAFNSYPKCHPKCQVTLQYAALNRFVHMQAFIDAIAPGAGTSIGREVCMMPASGSSPKQLPWHPNHAMVCTDVHVTPGALAPAHVNIL